MVGIHDDVGHQAWGYRIDRPPLHEKMSTLHEVESPIDGSPPRDGAHFALSLYHFSVCFWGCSCPPVKLCKYHYMLWIRSQTHSFADCACGSKKTTSSSSFSFSPSQLLVSLSTSIASSSTLLLFDNASWNAFVSSLASRSAWSVSTPRSTSCVWVSVGVESAELMIRHQLNARNYIPILNNDAYLASPPSWTFPQVFSSCRMSAALVPVTFSPCSRHSSLSCLTEREAL